MSEESAVQSKRNFYYYFKYFILHALNPVLILEQEIKRKWYFYLVYPALGWMLFFLQVGIDKSREVFVPQQKIILLSVTGFLLGYIIVGLIGLLITFILKKLKRSTRADKVISSIALSHTYMLFSLVLGLVYNLLGFNSSATFGVAGLLCTLMPIYAGIRTLGRGSVFQAPLLATLVGVLLLSCWQLIMLISF